MRFIEFPPRTEIKPNTSCRQLFNGVQYVGAWEKKKKKKSEDPNKLQDLGAKAHRDIFCYSIVVIQTVQLLYLNHYCVGTSEFWILFPVRYGRFRNQRCRATMHRRNSFESLLISEGSLFTFPAAAGQINWLERVASLYTYKTTGPVGIKNFLGESY